jgi:hypothetical protein
MPCKYNLLRGNKTEHFRVMFTDSHEAFDEMTDYGNGCHKSRLSLTKKRTEPGKYLLPFRYPVSYPQNRKHSNIFIWAYNYNFTCYFVWT